MNLLLLVRSGQDRWRVRFATAMRGMQWEFPKNSRGNSSSEHSADGENTVNITAKFLFSLIASFYLYSMLDLPRSEFVFQCCTLGCIRSRLYFINKYPPNHVDVSGWVSNVIVIYKTFAVTDRFLIPRYVVFQKLFLIFGSHSLYWILGLILSLSLWPLFIL